MLPKILEFGLRRGEKNRADITDALSIALMEHLNSLERNLGIIGTIAVIAPFVGLFGTVLGIIRAFEDIALKGNSTPAVVAARRIGSTDHDRRRSVRRRRVRDFLQLLQVAHQGVQPRDDRRGEPARRDAALPQHRCADPDRAVQPITGRRDRRRALETASSAVSLLSAQQDDEVMAEINITPFTDVLLVLLIIFMILAALVTPPGFQKNFRTKQYNKTRTTDDPEEDIEVIVNDKGVIFVDGNEDGYATSIGMMAIVAIKRRGHKHVSITADAKAPYGRHHPHSRRCQRSRTSKTSVS